MYMYQFPACSLYFAHHKRRIDFCDLDFSRKWILRRINSDQMTLFQLVGVCVSLTNKHLQQYCILRLFGNFRIRLRNNGALQLFLEICFQTFISNKKKATSHTGLNNFPAFRSYHDGDFAGGVCGGGGVRGRELFQNLGFIRIPRIKIKTHLRSPFSTNKWLILVFEEVHLLCYRFTLNIISAD